MEPQEVARVAGRVLNARDHIVHEQLYNFLEKACEMTRVLF